MKKIGLFFLFMFVPLVAGVRDLIILIDDGEGNEQVKKNTFINTNECVNDTGAVTSYLIYALYQKAAPILVSASVWHNFIERRQIFRDFISLSIEDLVIKYNDLPCIASKDNVETFKIACQSYTDLSNKGGIDALFFASIYNLARHFSVCDHVAFDPKEWKLYMVSPSFCLLVPIAYSKSLEKIDDNPFPSLSTEQLQLGLKPLVLMKNPLDPLEYPKKIVDVSEKFISILPELFITKNDVKSLADKNKNEKYEYKYLHRWHIFLNGHGSQAVQSSPQIASIAGLKNDYFKRFLHFLNNMVITEFLMYETCFAGGRHLLTPYERNEYFPSENGNLNKNISADIFNFTIVTGTLFTEETNVIQPQAKLGPKNKEITIESWIKFDDFFKQLKIFLQIPTMRQKTLFLLIL
jgi:hypothetical protein